MGAISGAKLLFDYVSFGEMWNKCLCTEPNLIKFTSLTHSLIYVALTRNTAHEIKYIAKQLSALSLQK